MTCIVTVTYLTLVLIVLIFSTGGAIGVDVKVEDYPSKVVIRAFGVPHACGGVLITPKHVLTAAHCVLKKNPREEYLDAQPIKAYKVSLVDVTLKGNPTELIWKQDNELWVSKVDIHKNRLSSSNISADIALLTLFVAIEESKTRRHALLPTSESAVNEEVSALAYGFKYNVNQGVQGDEANHLKLATFKITNDSNCGSNNTQKLVDEFCVVNLKQDTCYGYAGDSVKNKKNEVVGIITSPWNCSIVNVNVLNIFPYKSWIGEIITCGSSPDTKHLRHTYTTFID